MKKRSRSPILRITLLAIFLISPAYNHALQAKTDRQEGNGTVSWFVELYQSNSDYIEVNISTIGVRSDRIVQEVFFDVTFYDGSHKLGAKRFFFTDASVEVLASGYIHRRWFAHPYQGATSAVGTCLYYAISISGTRQGHPTRFFYKKTDPGLKNSNAEVREYR